MRALVRVLASAGLLAGGLMSGPAVHAVVHTTAEVSLSYTNTPIQYRQDFNQTDGGDGFTSAIQNGSLPFTSGFAQALLPPGTGGPAVVMRVAAQGNSGGLDVGGYGSATAEIFTDEIVFTTPANSAGMQFPVGFDFHATGTLTATGAGLATANLSVLFYSFSLPDEELSPTHFYFDTNTMKGSDPVTVSRSGFTSYSGGPVLLPGAAQQTDWKFYLDVSLSVDAINVWCSGCGLPATGSANSDFANTFTGELVYDPALTLHSPFNAALVPELGRQVMLLAGLVVIGLVAPRRLRRTPRPPWNPPWWGLKRDHSAPASIPINMGGDLARPAGSDRGTGAALHSSFSSSSAHCGAVRRLSMPTSVRTPPVHTQSV